MLAFILWYLTISIVGWLALPLAYRMLPGLADRGLAFSRTLGLLIWGYIFWLLASFGVVRNDAGGLLFALLLMVFVSILAMKGSNLSEFGTWLRDRSGLVLRLELLFFAAFAGWTLIRAANPEILGTEKPMELAFINAILRSPTFPPHDPWLSGYAISYYYFGYIMVAMLAKLTVVPGGVAFNLGIALVFALSAQGAYGLVYNLFSKAFQGRSRPSTSLPLLGPLFVLLVGNLEGFLEVLHARGLFWRVDAGGQWASRFWQWLDMVDLSLPPALPLSWQPTRYLWWWRASRVVQDYDYQKNLLEIIDEFPAFSYLLADLHPHVLAMPFVLLGIALAWNVLQRGLGSPIRSLRLQIAVRYFAWLAFLILAVGVSLVWNGVESQNLTGGVTGLVGIVLGVVLFIGLRAEIDVFGMGIFWRSDTGMKTLSFSLSAGAPILLFNSLVLGGLSFLNTWDFPFSVALFAGAFALGKRINRGNTSEDKADPPEGQGLLALLRDFLGIAIVIGLAGFFLYLPFYIGFASQAGGILPNLIFPTRGAHLWVMFAPLFLPLGCFLIYLRRRGSASLSRGILAAAGFFLILWALALLLAAVIIALPNIGSLYLGSLAAPTSSALFRQAFERRLLNSGGWITLLLLLGLVLSLLWPRRDQTGQWGFYKSSNRSFSEVNTFILLVCLLGTLLVIGPEFFFLRDQFGWRINSIFKFYYHAWLLWGVVVAFGSAVLIRDLRPPWELLYKITLVMIVAIGLTYLVLGMINTTSGFNPPQGWTLDGTAYMEYQSPDEMAAIRWLEKAPPGVVAEAVSPTGGSYTHYARVSMLSGQPGVLGWVGHESQWRGGSQEMGSRQADLERLYCTRDWKEAQDIIMKYDIRFVFVGDLERTTYMPDQGACATGLNEVKFRRFLDPVIEMGSVVVYQVK